MNSSVSDRRQERSLHGVAGVPVVPSGGGQGQDPRQDAGWGVATATFQAELNP
jgi:hypothetical protein